jgi:hypothetical protein
MKNRKLKYLLIKRKTFRTEVKFKTQKPRKPVSYSPMQNSGDQVNGFGYWFLYAGF